ncbi:LysM peptidoglycan-binding domain-containing protein [Rhizobiaceae bacterium]|nr:LysM peptidoglycan-binding domain-containing protein [Rhizobiaceae bacterium]
MVHPTLDIQQPQPFDIVSDTVLVAGNAVAFEGTLTFNLSEGHDDVDGFFTVAGTQLQQFQGEIPVPADNAFKLPTLQLRLADDSGNEDGPSVIIPILYGPLILPGYTGYRPYTVKSGDTLARIAREIYGEPNFHPIVAANPQTITDPDRIFVGQELRIPVAD